MGYRPKISAFPLFLQKYKSLLENYADSNRKIVDINPVICYNSCSLSNLN